MEVGELLPRLSILTSPKRGGLFLLPFSGGYPRLTLSATLPYDARTFLTVIPFGNILRGRPTKLRGYYITLPLFCQHQGINLIRKSITLRDLPATAPDS